MEHRYYVHKLLFTKKPLNTGAVTHHSNVQTSPILTNEIHFILPMLPDFRKHALKDKYSKASKN
jgi:hypothetical protein